MVGGLAMLGGLTGSGAAVAAGALAARGTVESITLNVTQLKLRVAADLALKRLGLPIDNTLWEQLTTLETQISAELNRLETFSDSKASRVGQLNAAKEAGSPLGCLDDDWRRCDRVMDGSIPPDGEALTSHRWESVFGAPRSG
jgi:hypothetical protein